MTVNVNDVEEYVILAQEVTETQQSVSEPDGQDLPEGVSTTGRVVVGGSATGDIETRGDRDWFAVELDAGRTYRIDLKGSRTGAGTGTLLDPYLRGVHDADGVLITGTTNNDGGVGRNSRVEFTATANATYYVAAGAFGDGARQLHAVGGGGRGHVRCAAASQGLGRRPPREALSVTRRSGRRCCGSRRSLWRRVAGGWVTVAPSGWWVSGSPPPRSYSERMSLSASLCPTVNGSFRNALSTAQLRPHSRIHPRNTITTRN